MVVSHSATLAEGAAELAREMGGDAPIEAAGGLDQPDGPLGTDAAFVLAAIERAYSDDGVLVLMDLGSAIMSAEMAIAMLDPARQAHVRLSAAPLVEGAVAAAATAGAGATLEAVSQEAQRGLEAKVEHLRGDRGGPEEVNGEEKDRLDEQQEGSVVLQLVIHNPTGLHARPAARFVKTASAFGAEVSLTNLTKDKGPVNARSLVSVTTLGVTCGDAIRIEARGEGAREVISALEALAGRNFDE
ncbi:MAG: PTS-dependent dihydroxyacetone kinase phosphotransferase subunit DhaM [Actinobacteria bacterium]|nr:PTS-dependent dihydroxyacetone kinase phosphotransferase subunit DhaM [Actinomycetota bacterium]